MKQLCNKVRFLLHRQNNINRMETLFLVVVIFLLILSIVDLNAGVSNDAVNFLNSAVGTKAASMRIIFVVASLGVFFGATTSNGMMEIARNGVLHPQYFYANELLIIFLSVMISDIILLNVFNTLGLPTSTTVSMVFELIGGAVAMSIIKTYSGSIVLPMSELLNADKALTMILGIFLSVVIAFVFGAIVQYLSRLLFTFNYKKNLKWKIGLFGGLSITIILYFMLIKGLKSASFMTPEISNWIGNNTWQLMIGCFIFFTILMQIFYYLKINVFKIIIMIGTFSLAMAFAGNDLVNFIGVPLAGLSTYQDFVQNGTGSIDTHLMKALNHPATTPFIYLLIAGAVMVFSLVTSKKAKKVLQTSIGLSSQNGETELFGSSAIARSIVRVSMNIANFFKKITPKKMQDWIESRFDLSDAILEDKAAFDLVRGCVNLVLSGLLIALGTSLKLPLSTTYVAFMVAMGSSLADKAWGRESAVFRVTGVFSVIGGWLVTAAAAFTLCFVITFINYYGSALGMILMIALAAYILFKMNFSKEKTKNDEDPLFEKIAQTKDQRELPNLILQHVRESLSEMIDYSKESYSQIVDGFMNEDVAKLRKVVSSAKDEKIRMKILKRREIKGIQQMDSKEIAEINTWFHLSYNCIEGILYSLRRICDPVKEHVDSSFTPLDKKYFDELQDMKFKVLMSMDLAKDIIQSADFADLDASRELMKSRKDYILEIGEQQIKRIQSSESGLDVSLLYLNIIQESQEIITELRHLVRDVAKMHE
jgi:Phosphate/sulphate permeases